ncbi:MAG: hypothetical protein V7750_05615 [Sneathiella sp.]
MNFAGKKLNGFYTDARSDSSREEKLLAENRSLKKKNKRLSTAMIYLVDQIEVRLPLWSPKPPLLERKKTLPAKPKIIGEGRKIKNSTLSGERNTDKARSQPLSLQQIFADKRKTSPSKLTPSLPIKTLPSEEIPIVVEITAPAEEIGDGLSLAPEEINLLAAPTKENAKDPELLNSSENMVERVAKKTSLREASLTYMAVSVAASPVPDSSELEEDFPEESKISVHNKVMREAMLRRVNRLRW